MKTKEKYGQYFTTNNGLKSKIFEFILNNPKVILEPSIGRGDLVDFIITKNPHITFDMYEIDNDIKLLDNIDKNKVIYGDFIRQVITTTYKTIIGNPPYIRTKKGNLYLDFIEKCYNLLEENGELIFIVPSDFFKLTKAAILLDKMMNEGSFTHIYNPYSEKLFEKANIEIIIFRYCKNSFIEKIVIYNDKNLHIINNKGLITFEEIKNDIKQTTFENYFNIYVGLVSGKDEVYKNKELGNIEVITAENNKEKYIYINSYPCENDNINNHLIKYKEQLISRGIRKFNENNWFEWGAMRNLKAINENYNKDCIYVHNLTRKKKIAFIGKVNYFGGGLLMLIPKNNYDINNLNKIVYYLNSHKFKHNFMSSGRIKIGHRQLSYSYLPAE